MENYVQGGLIKRFRLYLLIKHKKKTIN